MNRNLIICGDLHGDPLPTLVEIVPPESDVLIVGDIGAGFGGPNSFRDLVKRCSKKLERKDINIYGCRGNHDDPDFFNGRCYEGRVTLLEDHIPIKIQEKLIYPVGGAPSHDKEWRLKENAKMERFGSHKRVWWPGECIRPTNKPLPGHIDIVISHDSPTYFDPPLIREDGIDWDTYNEIVEGRRYLSSLLNESSIDSWFFGHYHESFSGVWGGCLWRGLSPLELYYVTKR